MENQKKEAYRCPTCGKFITENQYNKLVDIVDENERLKQQVQTLLTENGKYVTRIAAQTQRIEELQEKCLTLTSDKTRLLSRGLWARVINKVV